MSKPNRHNGRNTNPDRTDDRREGESALAAAQRRLAAQNRLEPRRPQAQVTETQSTEEQSIELDAAVQEQKLAERKARLQQRLTRSDLMDQGVLRSSRTIELGTKAADIVRIGLGLDFLPEGEKALVRFDEDENLLAILDEMAEYDRRNGRARK